LDGLRGEDSIAELCHHEGGSQGVYYKWSKDFMEAANFRLTAAPSPKADSPHRQNGQEGAIRCSAEYGVLSNTWVRPNIEHLKLLARLKPVSPCHT